MYPGVCTTLPYYHPGYTAVLCAPRTDWCTAAAPTRRGKDSPVKDFPVPAWVRCSERVTLHSLVLIPRGKTAGCERRERAGTDKDWKDGGQNGL